MTEDKKAKTIIRNIPVSSGGILPGGDDWFYWNYLYRCCGGNEDITKDLFQNLLVKQLSDTKYTQKKDKGETEREFKLRCCRNIWSKYCQNDENGVGKRRLNLDVFEIRQQYKINSYVGNGTGESGNNPLDTVIAKESGGQDLLDEKINEKINKLSDFFVNKLVPFLGGEELKNSLEDENDKMSEKVKYHISSGNFFLFSENKKLGYEITGKEFGISGETFSRYWYLKFNTDFNKKLKEKSKSDPEGLKKLIDEFYKIAKDYSIYNRRNNLTEIVRKWNKKAENVEELYNFG